MKKIIALLLFLSGILATIFFERITDKVFPKEIETVNLAKDTLFVIPVRNEKIIIEKNNPVNSKVNNTTNKELEYWKNIALKNEKISNESLAKEIDNLKTEIKSTNNSKISTKEFIPDKGYNELITNSNTLFPNKKGYQPSSITNYFEGQCPDFNIKEDYITLDFLIRDKTIFEKSGVIFVAMSGIKNNEQYYFIYDEYYTPQYGYNHLKLKNVNKSGRYKFTFGIIFKSEMNKEFPIVNGFNCHFKK